MFRYCPCCAAVGIQFINNKLYYCKDCGFTYYHNTAAATGCIINSGESLLFLVRGKEPALGKLDLPGGFVDPGEGALEGLIRECREELGWPAPGVKAVAAPAAGELPLGSETLGFTFFASFPNVYPYKGTEYNTCDLFFTVTAPALSLKDLTLDPKEIREARFILPRNIDLDELAFDSTRRAVKAYLAAFHS